jgi:broad specificity phosphatase PhoE
MGNLILIRHSEPEWGRHAPPSEWLLTDRGRYRATLLGEYLRNRRIDRIISSAEIKAIQTAEIAASAAELKYQVSEPKLNEHNREGENPLSSAERRQIIVKSLRNPHELIYGNETIAGALARFREGLELHVDSSLDEPVAVVSHGTVISAFAESELEIDAVELWDNFGLPGLIEFEWPNGDTILDQRAFE